MAASTPLSSMMLDGVGMAGKVFVENIGASTMSVSLRFGSARDFLLGRIEDIMTSSSSISTSEEFSRLKFFLGMGKEFVQGS